MQVLTSRSNRKYKNKFILAIGGGKVIDEAKRMARRCGRRVIAIATTGSGAGETAHAVKWGETKRNIKTDIPISIKAPFKIRLNKSARYDTDMDIICHLIDILQKCTDNDRVQIGSEVGKWLEKYGSGLTHKKSYAIKIRENITHGASLRKVIIPCIEKAYPIDK